jgi:hypothetical protein
MKWFFALNDASPAFPYYAGMVKVAVHSALANTDLEPVFVYDGGENELMDWLADRGVMIIRRSSVFSSQIEGLADGKKVQELGAIARGAYLRVEVPQIVREQRWADKFVLYTDCDVMFLPEFRGAALNFEPDYFAVAPEENPEGWEAINTGVMLMNVDALLADYVAFKSTILRELERSVQSSFDQHAYRIHYQGRWAQLPSVLNWKPHWGINPEAQIIHFHGPKPFQKYAVAAGIVPQSLQALATDAYFAYAELFDRLLAEAIRSEEPDSADADVLRGELVVEEGFLPEEGPHPELGLPRVRWGLAPRMSLRLRVMQPESVLRISGMTQVGSQEITIRHNGCVQRTHSFKEVGVFESIRVALREVQSGDLIEIFASKSQTNSMGCALAVLFRKIELS